MSQTIVESGRAGCKNRLLRLEVPRAASSNAAQDFAGWAIAAVATARDGIKMRIMSMLPSGAVATWLSRARILEREFVMRKLLLVAATCALALVGTRTVLAGGGCADATPDCGATWGDSCGTSCGCRLFGHHCHLFGHHGGHGQRIEGLDPYFNCGCGGSYNYPVPPLYTYHWPGMYKQQLMTDYRSPWRFPPLKPYVDEIPLPMAEVIDSDDGQLYPVSLERGLRPLSGTSDRIESISSRLERSGR